MASYEALVGLDWEAPSGHRRVEAGEIVDDIPSKSVAWLVDGGSIRLVKATPKDKPAKPERVPDEPEEGDE